QFYLKELGIAVITPNVRGSTGYGKTYATLDDGILREDSVRDIGALLDWIARDDRLDASRVAVIGGSYGGYMTLASLVHFGAKIRAGIDVVGISNFRTFLERTSAYRRDLRRAEYGDEREEPLREFFEKISPANRIHELRSALFTSLEVVRASLRREHDLGLFVTR
ncbi:MAG: alpha/beta fold hydrolase, partial [candidate division NC10 bacterium]